MFTLTPKDPKPFRPQSALRKAYAKTGGVSKSPGYIEGRIEL